MDDEKELNKKIDSGREIDSLQRNWEEGHYGETVDKMMAVDFNEFPKEVIFGAAIFADIVERDQLVLSQLESQDLSEDFIRSTKETFAENKRKIKEKLVDLSGISQEDSKKLQDMIGHEGEELNEGSVLAILNVAYRMQKRIFFMRKGQDVEPFSRKSEKMNNEFMEASQVYIDADNVKSMEFFEEVFGDDFNKQEESDSVEYKTQKDEGYEILEDDESIVINGKKTEKVEGNLAEQVGVAKGALLLRSIKESKYNSAEDLLNSGAVVNNDIKQGLEALKMRAVKEGDNEKIVYIDKILNFNK